MKNALIPAILLLSAIVLLSGCSQQSNPPTNPTTTQSNAGTANYSLAELALHNSPTDCWIAVDGNAYNITEIASHSPAGSNQNPLAANCGKQVDNFPAGRPPMQDSNSQRFDRNSMPASDKNLNPDRNFPNRGGSLPPNNRPGNDSFPNRSNGGSFLLQYYIGKLKE